ncbi:CaiB/BaiF CoA transferase family protein [Dongia sp.]|uniref:CaiB/BaiF CoA transferase family protein n=1 Tax=Dongia sp. TaxID=1977262 RepID=UPI0035B3ACE5
MTQSGQAPTAKDIRQQGPLAGIVVIDLTRVLAGPFCTMLLADLGARVIKIENPNGGDDSRAYGPFINGKSGYFIAQNRGKESIALDLKQNADKAILHRLLKRADVLIENFRPGTMARLGFGQMALKEMYPQLIYASTSGFGQTGPYADRPAYDIIAQAMGGIMSITGHEGNEPTRVGASIGDLGAGLFTTIGIVSALHHRNRSGEGITVDVAMLDSQLALLENAIARYYSSGKAPKPLGARHPSIAPFEAYRTQDSHVVIACGNDGLFRTFCEVIEHPHLADDPRFATNAKRSENVIELKTALEAFLTGKTTDHWLDLFNRTGIPSAPINDVAQAIHDPQVQHRQIVLPVDDDSVAPLAVAGSPIKFSGFPQATSRPRAPELDEDRARILADFP